MELAESKYKTLVETGKWKQQSAEDHKIVALTAQLNKLKVAKPEKAPPVKRSKEKKKSDADNMDKWLLTPPIAGGAAKQQKGGNDW